MATFFPVEGARFTFFDVQVLLLVVGDETLEVSDAERLHLLAHQAPAFAVIFLRADAARDRRQHVVFANFRRSAHEVAGDDQLHELPHLHAHGALIGAGRLGAFQAAQRFLAGQFSRSIRD